MSHTEQITGERRALVAGVERPQGSTAAADRQAQEVALHAASAGLLGVTARLARVHSALTDVQVGLGCWSLDALADQGA
ncbi:hypothetical protein ACN268_10285 [Micromonospora sp. WMMD735]|uniref:hypothetical protein n=1 Tax=Micromonospora sp. WMMD735 TaxID=3404130 RepID=UPI003B943F1E